MVQHDHTELIASSGSDEFLESMDSASHDGDVATSLRQRLGANLRAERRRRRLTQEDLAEQLGVTARYLGGIERAERNMTLDSVDALAQELGIDALDLLSSTPSEGLAQRP